MRFMDIMRDRRGFIHKRLIGGVTGFLGGGGIAGGIAGFIGGGRSEKAVPGVLPADPRGRPKIGRFGRRIFPPSFNPPFVPGVMPVPFSPLATSISQGPGPTQAGPFGLPVPCVFPFVRQADGSCKFDLDPGQGTGFPGGDGGGGSFPAEDIGLASPATVCIETQVCPTFADGKKGVLWMNALTGQVFCLPRGTNGTGFGLIRKNRPRRKAFVTAAEISALRKQATTKKKAKKFAALTGQTCVTRGTQRSRH